EEENPRCKRRAQRKKTITTKAQRHGVQKEFQRLGKLSCRRSIAHHFWWKGGWKSAFFQSSILPSFRLKWGGTLRLRSPRFADTPTRPCADTASLWLPLCSTVPPLLLAVYCDL